MTFKDARPWAVAIKDEVLNRRMPPWGAVKGFGEFRNDQGLSSEEVELLVSWIDGGVPEGEPNTLPEEAFVPPVVERAGKAVATVNSRGYVVVRAMKLDGLQPLVVPKGSSMQVVAELPDGTVEPLVWLEGYQEKFPHAFLFATPRVLPAGTRISGVAPGATIGLIPSR
jgi:hypothetical protein